MTTTIPYGSWPSPLSAVEVSAASPRLEGARFVGDELWWGESVPEQGGRTAVRRRGASGEVIDVLPAPWNARSRVHEYGGAAWTTTDDGDLIFVEKEDQRIWILPPGDGPRPLTPPDTGMRFGGLTWQGGRLFAIRETHDGQHPAPRRDIVEVPLDRSAVWDAAAIASLTEDSDFLAQPALSADGSHLAWIAWNHPNMPWDTTELRVGRIEDGIVAEWATVAGGDGTAPLQPVWTGDDELVYIDDPTGRWNLWRLRLTADLHHEPIAPVDADTGGPLWVLGLRWFALLDDGRIVAVRTNGEDAVVVIGPDGTATPLDLEVTANVVIEDVRGTKVLLTGSGSRSPAALWLVDVDDPAAAERVAGGTSPWGDEWMPQPRAVTFPGRAVRFTPSSTRPRIQTRRPPKASDRHTSCSCTAGRRVMSPAQHPPRSRISPAAGSASSTSTTAARRAMGARTASACAGSGASSMSRTWSPPPEGSPSRDARMRHALPSREVPPAGGPCSAR